MEEATLILLISNNELALSVKKRGFGAILWNGYGGKVKPKDKSVEEAALRELKEENMVAALKSGLQPAGKILFHFDNVPKWQVHIFLCREWLGIPIETEEMGPPEFFEFDKIPYDKMWPSDRLWLPQVLKGQKVEGEVFYDKEGEKVLDHRLCFS